MTTTEWTRKGDDWVLGTVALVREVAEDYWHFEVYLPDRTSRGRYEGSLRYALEAAEERAYINGALTPILDSWALGFHWVYEGELYKELLREDEALGYVCDYGTKYGWKCLVTQVEGTERSRGRAEQALLREVMSKG